MPEGQWQVFLDTNVIISGLASSKGASAAILDLGEAEEIKIVISRHVLIEADRVFSHKFPHLIERFRLFIKNLGPLLLDGPKPQAVREAHKIIELGDAPILAAVKTHSVDYLVTLNTKHFKTPQVRGFIKSPVLTPAEFLGAFRDYWENQGN